MKINIENELNALMHSVIDEINSTDEDLSEFLEVSDDQDLDHAKHSLPENMVKTRAMIDFLRTGEGEICSAVYYKLKNNGR